MNLRCTEATWPDKDRLDSYPWITAAIAPHKVLAVIPHGETGSFCPEDEEVCTVLFESGFRWAVRARRADLDDLRAAMGLKEAA